MAAVAAAALLARRRLGFRYLVLMLTAGGGGAALAFLDAQWWDKPELPGAGGIVLVAGLAAVLALTMMRYRAALLTGACAHCLSPLLLTAPACGRCGQAPAQVEDLPPGRAQVLFAAGIVVLGTTVLLTETGRWLLVMTDGIPLWLARYLTLEAGMLALGMVLVAGGLLYLRLLLAHPALARAERSRWLLLLGLGIPLLVLAHLPGLLTAEGRARQRRVAYHNFVARGGPPAGYAAAREMELNNELAQLRGSE